MKMNFTLLLAGAMCLFGSCRSSVIPDDIIPSDEPKDYPLEMTFYGVNDNHSRTVINDELILWESGDEIKVLWGDNAYNKATAKTYNSGVNAEFATTVEQASEYFGVYPYSAVSSLSDGVVNVTVPETQSGLFADANIAVAKADVENNLAFRHVVSFLEFTVDKTGVLEFAAGSNSLLTGKVAVKAFDTDGNPVYEVEGSSASVTMDIKSSGTYYIALLPDAQLDMLSFTLSHDGINEYIVSTKPITMKPGKLVSLGNITDRFKSTRPLGATLESFKLEEFQFDW